MTEVEKSESEKILKIRDENGRVIRYEITSHDIKFGPRRATSFRVNSNVHRYLKAFSALTDRADGEIVNLAIVEYLEKNQFINIKR